MNRKRLFSRLRITGITVKIPFVDIELRPNPSYGHMHKSWISMKNGSVPDSVEAPGYDSDATPLYIARAKIDDGLCIGKVGRGFKAAKIPFNGIEVDVEAYEVYVGEVSWIWASDGKIPIGAIVAGAEADGTPLFVARAKYKGGVHIGKVREGFTSAKIPYGGQEIDVNPYEILVAQ